MTPKRTRPLTASSPVTASYPATSVAERSSLRAPPPLASSLDERDERDERDVRADKFAADVRTLRIGRASVVLSERILLILGGILAPLGIVVVIYGWWGASHTAYEFEQTPYLISGGLLGLGLTFIGCFFYFAHWLTQLVKEHREQSAAILAALERLYQAEIED